MPYSPGSSGIVTSDKSAADSLSSLVEAPVPLEVLDPVAELPVEPLDPEVDPLLVEVLLRLDCDDWEELDWEEDEEGVPLLPNVAPLACATALAACPAADVAACWIIDSTLDTSCSYDCTEARISSAMIRRMDRASCDSSRLRRRESNDRT